MEFRADLDAIDTGGILAGEDSISKDRKGTTQHDIKAELISAAGSHS